VSSPGKVPALGQIPTIGKLFRSKTAAPDQLLVFVTARIVRRAGEQVKNQ
jgi:type II secretory pathway component GspD/PulD (secretin)